MNLRQVIEHQNLASWYRIYALRSDGKFTLDCKVVDETEIGAKFFASKGFVDSIEGTTEDKLARINHIDETYRPSANLRQPFL